MRSVVRAADGTEISFTDSGGSGQPVLMLHGVMGTSRIAWETRLGRHETGRIVPVDGATVGSTLRHAGARTICIDARGHGHSGRSDDPARYRGDAHVHDVVAVLDALDLPSVAVIGYSMGANTAARLAGTADLRVATVALCGMGIRHIRDATDTGLDAIANVGRVFLDDSWDDNPHLGPYRSFARLDPVHHFPSIGAAMLGLEAVPVERFSSTNVPVLVLNGGSDNADDDAGRIAAMIPGATSAVVGNGNHVLAFHDDDYRATLISYLQGTWRH